MLSSLFPQILSGLCRPLATMESGGRSHLRRKHASLLDTFAAQDERSILDKDSSGLPSEVDGLSATKATDFAGMRANRLPWFSLFQLGFYSIHIAIKSE